MAKDPVDELYGADPGDFVARRDALARQLRDGGDRETAAQVRKLAKPTRAGFALNRLVRERPDEIRALVDAGEALAAAQGELLGGADASVLRGAAEAARRLVDALADEAGADGPTRDKVRATLHAATVDRDVRAELAAGRVTREREASGFGGLEDALAAAPAPKRATVTAKGRTAKAASTTKGATATKARSDAQAKARAEVAEREARKRRDALRRAKEAEATAEGGVDGARHALEQVQATVRARERELQAAEAALSAARERRERAEQALA